MKNTLKFGQPPRAAYNKLLYTPVDGLVKESDWKIFKKIKETALDSFCENSLNEISDVIGDKSKPAHERYLLSYRLMQNRDKQLALMFDGLSRSKAKLQLISIRGEGLADENLLKELTPEFLEQTDPEKAGW